VQLALLVLMVQLEQLAQLVLQEQLVLQDQLVHLVQTQQRCLIS
jgi:hypothetical protein